MTCLWAYFKAWLLSINNAYQSGQPTPTQQALFYYTIIFTSFKELKKT